MNENNQNTPQHAPDGQQYVAREARPVGPAPAQGPPAAAPRPQQAAHVPYTQAGAPYAPAAYPAQYGMPYVAPKRKLRAIEISLIAISLVIVVMLGTVLVVLASVAGSVGSAFTPTFTGNVPPSGTFSVIRVVGEMVSTSSGALGINDPSYHHAETVEYVNYLAEDAGNTGILLFLDTPGGGVYESDELYRALDNYKEKTGRPVWAYMSTTCASGGVYAAVAAEHIVANYNTTTGSIGVYIAMTDSSGLYDKLGLRTVLVRSGSNKGVGTSGVPITDANADVYQSIVDEKYDRFVSVVADGRGMAEKDVLALADGRVYTAEQALDNGLVDELGEWEQVLEQFKEETGSTEYYPNFSMQTALGQILAEISGILPQSDAQAALALAARTPSGVPMAYAPELAAAR